MGIIKKAIAAIPVYIADGISVVVNDLSIGAVELKDALTDTRAKVKTDGVDNAVVVMQNSAPLGAGAATEATLAIVAGDTTSIDGKTPADPAREGGNLATVAGDTTSIDGKTPALGAAASAASSPTVLATDDAHLGAVGAAADVDGNIHGQLRYIGEAAEANTCNVGNAPASPGQCLAVTAAQVDISLQVTQADLVPGVKYRMRLTPDVLTNIVHGVWKCSAAGAIASVTDGTPIMQHEEVIIKLPLGSTKVRVYFWLPGPASVATMTSTPFDCHVWLSQADA